MMSTFHIIHVIVGAWLIFSNLSKMLTPSTLVWSNVIMGAIIAVYNLWFLFVKGNTEVKNQ